MSNRSRQNNQGKDHDSQPLIRVENVSFSYREHLVLKEVTFSITRGDFLAIIGPNGSGKSTLLKIILGLIKCETGSVNIMGQPVEKFKRWDLIGYVPQKATHVDSLFPLSVAEVVSLGRLSTKKWPKWIDRDDRKRVKEALKKVGMETFSRRRISELSGGQQQRVFIARAIVNDPLILFLDEPTTGIDSEAREEFYDLLDKLNKQGITVVLVTHDIGVVNKHVNKVACLNQSLVFHGSHEEFCSSPKMLGLIAGDHHLILHEH